MKLKDIILEVLAENEQARNDDNFLSVLVWRKLNPEAFIMHDGGWFVSTYYLINKLPSQDNIKRVRAKIQNEERLFLPTSMSVAFKRSRTKKDADSYKEWETKNYE